MARVTGGNLLLTPRIGVPLTTEGFGTVNIRRNGGDH